MPDLLEHLVGRVPDAETEIKELEDQRAAIDDRIRRLQAFKRWATSETQRQRPKSKRRGGDHPSGGASPTMLRRVAEACLALKSKREDGLFTQQDVCKATGISPRSAGISMDRLNQVEFLRKAGRGPDKRLLYGVYPDASLDLLTPTGGSSNGKA